jgi:ankyrin repeat protein
MDTFSSFSKTIQKTMLEMAIQSHNLNFVKSIIQHKSSDPEYFLFSAIFNNDLLAFRTKIEELVRVKKFPKTPSSILDYFSNNNLIPFDTPIHLATHLENTDALDKILSILPNLTIDQKNAIHETPLHIAVRNASLRMVNFLVSRDSRDLSSSQNLFSISHLACINGHTDIFKLISYVNSEGGLNRETPLFMAIKNQKSANFFSQC